jgi:hypothetical protein
MSIFCRRINQLLVKNMVLPFFLWKSVSYYSELFTDSSHSAFPLVYWNRSLHWLEESIMNHHHRRSSRKETVWSHQATSDGSRKVFAHASWNIDIITNVIAVLRSERSVQFDQFLQSPCLPGWDPKSGSDVILIGWEAKQLGGRANHQLKQTRMRVVGDCDRFRPAVDELREICVRNVTTDDSACQSHNGSPELSNSTMNNGSFNVSAVLDVSVWPTAIMFRMSTREFLLIWIGLRPFLEWPRRHILPL